MKSDPSPLNGLLSTSFLLCTQCTTSNAHLYFCCLGDSNVTYKSNMYPFLKGASERLMLRYEGKREKEQQPGSCVDALHPMKPTGQQHPLRSNKSTHRFGSGLFLSHHRLSSWWWTTSRSIIQFEVR